MDPNDQVTAPEAEADTTLTPSETDGVSSSDTTDDAPESAADAILRDFQETYGDDEPDEPGDSEGEEEPDADAAADEQKPETDEGALAEADDTDDDQFRIPDDQFKALPDGVKKRLGHLNARAKKAERELTAQGEEMEPLRDAHQRFTQLQTYVTENGIEPQNVTLAFDAMAKLSKGDFAGFVGAIEPWYQHAKQAMGEAIPADLQQRVDDGYLTAEDAAELTKARVLSQVNQGKVKQLTERNESITTGQAQERTRTEMFDKISAREAELKASDPDYAHKSQAIMSMVEFALKGGAVPKTAADAVALVNDAYERVNATFVKPRSPKPTPPRPSASTSPRGNPPPETTKQAIEQSLRDFPTS